MISPPVSVTLCILQSSNCSKMPIQSETPSSLYRLLLGEELWKQCLHLKLQLCVKCNSAVKGVDVIGTS